MDMIFTALGGLGGIVIIWEWTNKTFLQKHLLLKKINKLAPEVTIDYFINNLGNPTIVNRGENQKEYIFVFKWAYVSASTDLNGQVLMFSVTTRSKRFKPHIILGPFSTENKVIVVKLGKTTFSHLDKIGTGKVVSGMGARRGYYVEEYYFGNPGNYQTFAFSFNQAGYGKGDYLCVLNFGAESSADPRIQVFRNDTTINTYSITSPYITLEEIENGSNPGPNYDQVRVMVS